MDKQVGLVGIGIMGGAFLRHLRAAGFAVTGYDPAPAAQQALRDAGGTPAASAGAVAEAAPIVITSLPSIAVFDGVMGAIAGAAGSGQIVIECSTLPLDVKQRGHDALAAGGKILLDCPVSGTGAQAAAKDLVVFASGDEAAYRRCAEVFAGMSRLQRYLGPFGNGSKMKFIANLLVVIHNTAAAEALVLGQKAGLDPQLVYDTLQDSAGSSRMLQVRGPQMVAGRYEPPTATIKTLLKDIGIIGDFAHALHCPVPLFGLTATLYDAGLAQGLGDQDAAAVCTVLERLAGIAR